MASHKHAGPLGGDTNKPTIDPGTNTLSQAHPPVFVGPELRADPISPTQAKWNALKQWLSEVDDSVGMLSWWLIGSPKLGLPSGDLEFTELDQETEHIRSTPAYLEAVEIYQDWLNHGQPLGQYSIEGTDCEFVPEKGYFFVEGRTGGTGPKRGHWYEPLQHPLWGFTGTFSIRFTELGYPKEGYVSVEIENYTSLASYMHGLAGHSPTDSWYTKKSGIPIYSRSRQVYRFTTFIPRNAPAAPSNTTHKVVPGDSLSALAKTSYGDMELWPVIYDQNREAIGSDPSNLKIGLSLSIPAKQSLTPDQIMKAKQRAHSSR